MKKQYRLKKNYQYNYVYRKGRSIADNNLVLIYCQHRGNTPKFGFSVSGKFGCAVKRNRIRRQMKECATALMPFVKTNYTYVFLPKTNVTNKYKELYESMNKLLTNADLLAKQQG